MGTSAAVPDELAASCADICPARPDDAVSGQAAKFVAAPASTEEAAALLRAAARLALTVVPRGTGSRLTWGCPPSSCDLLVDTRRLGAVLEHAAGDLVVRVQAGVRLTDLQAKLAAEGQRLALDPPGESTIGGLIATNVAGPLRFRYGAPRDLLIGITVVRADGTVAKAGGKVVKNVAGYDLGKLFAGSYGTLGLITEATFRLHPCPATTAWITLDCPDTATAADAALAAASSPLAPSAIELDWPSAAAPISVAVLLEGSEASVAERALRMKDLLGRRGIAEPVGRRGIAEPQSAQRKRADRDLGTPAPRASQATLIRVAFWAGQLAAVLEAVRTAAAEHEVEPAISGSAAGLLEVAAEHEAEPEAVARFVGGLRTALSAFSGPVVGSPPTVASAVVVDAPAEIRSAVDMWGPVPSAGLMRAVKDQFDPEHRLAPGRFAGGI